MTKRIEDTSGRRLIILSGPGMCGKSTLAELISPFIISELHKLSEEEEAWIKEKIEKGEKVVVCCNGGDEFYKNLNDGLKRHALVFNISI